jgi:hypothetical protein
MEKNVFTLEEVEKAIIFITENGYGVKEFIRWLDKAYEQIAEAYIQLGDDAPSGTNDVLNTLYTIKVMKRFLEGLLIADK